MLIYNIIKNGKNIQTFMNKNYKSEKLFDLLTNDASIENMDFFALSTRIILHNDLITSLLNVFSSFF